MPMPQLSVFPAIRQWTTECVRPGLRLDYWVGAICEAFLEMDCSSHAGYAFQGALTSVGVETLTFNQVQASAQDVYRTPSSIARGEQQPFYLITQRHNPWHVRQGGHVAYLRPGDAVLVDSAQSYELHFPQDVACLSVQMPRAWVGRWLTQLDCRAPRVVARDQGWGQSLSALCLQLAHDPAQALVYPQALLSDQLGAMLSAAIDAGKVSDKPLKISIYTQAEKVLMALLDQAGLTAQDVALALGISLRTLHRSFAASQTTFSGTLRRLRMAHAVRLLSQTRLVQLSIAEVGQRCGCPDASHFVRDFHRTTGMTPARWRKQAIGMARLSHS